MTDPDTSDPTTGGPTTSEDDTSQLDHDARTGGPDVNAPGNEPDSASPSEREQGDAGRFGADDL